jgi:hypothetical protein
MAGMLGGGSRGGASGASGASGGLRGMNIPGMLFKKLIPGDTANMVSDKFQGIYDRVNTNVGQLRAGANPVTMLSEQLRRRGSR